MKLAEGLLLRKQLVSKLEQLKPLKKQADEGFFHKRVQRINVSQGTADTEGVDEVTTETPKITPKEIYEEWDQTATSLRKLDAEIQRANWTADIDFTPLESMK